MMEELDELDGPAAIEALREIQRVCESYKGRIPEKQEAAPDGSAEHEGAESPEMESAEDEMPALEIEVSAEPSEDSEPPPRRFVDYGKPSLPRGEPPPPKRGPGRPKKGR